MSERIIAVLDQIEAEAETMAPDGRTALELLQAVYRDKRNPLTMRMRAARDAIPFESPKLAVTTLLADADCFGALLDKAILRSQSPPRQIEHRADETAPSVKWSGPISRPTRRLSDER
jgi:hypothetical protein